MNEPATLRPSDVKGEEGSNSSRTTSVWKWVNYYTIPTPVTTTVSESKPPSTTTGPTMKITTSPPRTTTRVTSSEWPRNGRNKITPQITITSVMKGYKNKVKVKKPPHTEDHHGHRHDHRKHKGHRYCQNKYWFLSYLQTRRSDPIEYWNFYGSLVFLRKGNTTFKIF